MAAGGEGGLGGDGGPTGGPTARRGRGGGGGGGSLVRLTETSTGDGGALDCNCNGGWGCCGCEGLAALWGPILPVLVDEELGLRGSVAERWMTHSHFVLGIRDHNQQSLGPCTTYGFPLKRRRL